MQVEWTRAWLYRVMICGKVEAVSIDDGCMDAGGIVWRQGETRHVAACAIATASFRL
jgi:hypothetical protein